MNNLFIRFFNFVLGEKEKPKNKNNIKEDRNLILNKLDNYTFGSSKEAIKIAEMLVKKTPISRRISRIITKFNSSLNELQNIKNVYIRRYLINLLYTHTMNSIQKSLIKLPYKKEDEEIAFLDKIRPLVRNYVTEKFKKELKYAANKIIAEKAFNKK